MTDAAAAPPPRQRRLLTPELGWPRAAPVVVREARVASLDWSVVVPGRGSLLGQAGHHRRIFRRSAGGIAVAYRSPAGILDEPAVLLGGYYNYFHNLVDYALSCRWIARLARDAWRWVLVPTAAQPFHGQTLDLFGVPQDRRLEVAADTFIRCRTLHLLPRCVVGTGRVIDRAGIAWARARAPLPGPGDGERIYVSRARAERRRLANEDEILPVLLRHGFTVIHAEAMSVAEQARRFRAARVVMGLHGAGLSNIIFAPPGCRVIELTTEGARAFPAYFRQLAAGCGHDYATARVRGDAEGTYRIDVAEMVAALDAAGARAG